MPTDPKFRTIARISKQPIALVISVYMFLLVDASRNVTRGHVDVTNEDLASALDVTDEEIEAILFAMQGRLINDGVLSGWENRQPKREDFGDESTGAKSSAQRKKEQRERQKQEQDKHLDSDASHHGHDMSRNVTLDKDKDKEEIKIKSNTKEERASPKGSRLPLNSVLTTDWRDWAATERPDLDVEKTFLRFKDHWLAAAGRAGIKADWPATWRNWVRGEKPERSNANAPPKKSFAQQDEEHMAARIAELTGRSKTITDITPRTPNELAITLG